MCAGGVQLRDVTFRYPDTERDVLAGVSLDVAPGETVALVGASGAGKSTIARLLLRFDDPTARSVAIDGRDVRDVTLHSLREQVGLLAQETLLPDVTIREAIAYGRPGATDAEIEDAARAAGAQEFISTLPDGYESSVGQRGRRLSRRPAPAHQHRPGVAARDPRARPRRADDRPGRRRQAGAARSALATRARAHDDRHLPRPGDRPSHRRWGRWCHDRSPARRRPRRRRVHIHRRGPSRAR